MKVKASELQPGQVVELEYGASENWREFIVDTVIPFDKMVTVKCHIKDFKTDFSCLRDGIVEVQDALVKEAVLL